VPTEPLLRLAVGQCLSKAVGFEVDKLGAPPQFAALDLEWVAVKHRNQPRTPEAYAQS
jgi:hypothetical protein